MKNHIFVFLVGAALLVLTQKGVTATCESDSITIPSHISITSLQKQAESGNTVAQAQIGMAYLSGVGTKQDTNKGVHWLTKSAKGGNIEGQFLLGRYYALQKNNDSAYWKAAKWLKPLPDKGCTPALAYLGILSFTGKGGFAKDEKAGYEMLLKSAKSGYPFAEYMVGTLLVTGDGVKKDTKTGFIWVKRAAATGDPVARVLLATLYLEGTGTKKDPEKARTILLKLIEKGGEQGPFAAYYLGWMYMEGKGIPLDKIRALELMISAAHSHVAHSEALLQTLVQEVPNKKLITACSVYMEPNIRTKNAKEYLQANPDEQVIVLRQLKSSLKVFFPNRPLVGFISRSCISGK